MFVGPSYRTVATGQTGAFVGYDVRRDSFSGRRRMVGTPRETRARETGAAVCTRVVRSTPIRCYTNTTSNLAGAMRQDPFISFLHGIRITF